ncbi:AAA family ATPase [Reyranella sp.]|uniref:AAA family ATPase n=1 Tax=Reyranella sp. TaxID=1929291 RepID=UPI003BA88ED1
MSAGQAHGLVPARALLRDPRSLILDEPTQNLDAATARRLIGSLRAATQGRTVILITHDPWAAAASSDSPARPGGIRQRSHRLPSVEAQARVSLGFILQLDFCVTARCGGA